MKSTILSLALAFPITFGMLPGALFSQKLPQPQQLIYRLSDEEAVEFFKTGKLQPQPRHFLDLVETQPAGWGGDLPPGNYLTVKEYRGELSISLITSSKTSIQPLQERGEFAFHILDSLGAPIAAAVKVLGRGVLHFDKKNLVFRLRKMKKDSTRLLVRAGSEVAFFDVEKEFTGYRNQGGFFKKAFKNIRHPYRWSQRFYQKIRDRMWQRHSRRQEEEYRYKGYLALNKPKFLPGDTVKVKGYFTEKGGNPVRRTLELRLYNGAKYLPVKWVAPATPGAFVTEFVLHDSMNLKLDKDYLISFFDPQKQRNRLVFSHTFRYEDYQLDEVRYILTSDKKSYSSNDSIVLTAEGKFANGLRIPDGRVRLLVRSNVFSQSFQPVNFFEKEVRLPDTLWVLEQALDAAAPTRIALPDSIFPPVKLLVQAEAHFVNSNGELQMKSLFFSREPKANCLSLSLENGWVIGQCVGGGSSQPQQAWLEVSGRDFEHQKQVTLPFRERVNWNARSYSLRFSQADSPDEISEKLYPGSVNHNIEAGGRHRGDSLVFWIKNPHRLPVFFKLYKDKNIVEQGSTEEENFHQIHPANRGSDYRLEYHFIWAGMPYLKFEDFLFFKKKLQVAIEQPPTIEPGATVQVKVRVKDARQKAAPNVNLVAGAVNAQFDELKNYSGLLLNRKAAKFPRKHDHFDWEPAELPGASLPVTKDWAARLQLDTQFWFVNQGIFLRYDTVLIPSPIINQQSSITTDTFFQNVAQFAPYLIADGAQQAILLIYCNNQLVYFYGSDDNQPYSFIGRPGWNQIKLRTRHFEYEMDSVWLKKGCKLELVIHPVEYRRSPMGRHIRKKTAPEQLTDFEKNLVRRSFFLLRTNGEGGIYALSQGDENIHIFSAKSVAGGLVRVGPFRPELPLDYVWRDHFRRQINFEPGFSYSISPERERLYEYKWEESPPVAQPSGWFGVRRSRRQSQGGVNAAQPASLKAGLPVRRRGEVVFSPSEMLENSPMRARAEVNFTKYIPRTEQGNGSFLFYHFNRTPPLVAILLEKTGGENLVFDPSQRQFNNLAPGKYNFVFVGADSSILKKPFEILPNTLIFNNLNDLDFQRDSQGFWLETVLAHSQMKTTPAPAAPKIPNASLQFDGLVSGYVTDELGEPLIGASIFVRGTITGTVTDVDGFYQISLPPGARTLVVSYTGYAAQEIEIGGQGNYSIVMSASGEELEEIVVTALGSTSRTSMLVAHDLVEMEANEIWSPAQEIPQETGALEPGFQLRKNFRDEGFWQPNLATDANGEAWFTVTFPENTTRWNTFVLGMDERQRAGAGFASTNAFRQLMAQLAVPRFLIVGDRAEVIGKALNYTGDTLGVTTVFSQGETILKTNGASIGNALIEKTSVVAPSNLGGNFKLPPKLDSLTLRYTLASGSYGDGEERSLPIFPKGVDESEGGFFLLENDTSLTLDFPTEKGEITLRAEANVLKILDGSLDYLIQYPYGCTEQVSGRLVALLLAKELKTAMGEPFEREDFIKKAIETLSKTQHESGFWGWWQGGEANPWMTQYALGALSKARLAGYPSPALEKGLTWLTHRLGSLENQALLDALELFSDAGQNLDYAFYLTKLDSTLRCSPPDSYRDARHVSFRENPSKPLRPLTLEEQFTILKIRQAQGLPHDLDLLEQTVQTDLHGGVFWGELQNHSWYDSAVRTTLLACHLLKKAGKTERLAAAHRWLFRLRQRGGNWGNTIETAQVLAFLLPEILAKTGGNLHLPASLKVNGGEAFQKFPVEIKIRPGEPLRLEKTGASEVYLTAFQTFWNADPAPKTDIFDVKTWLSQGEKITSSLEASKPATLEIELTNAKMAEYVMLEAPIPAGCSYGEKAQAGSGGWRGGSFSGNQEVYREYFKEKVALFFETLPPGTHRFSIALEPRFSGSYTLNPARAEEMYLPVFFGRNGVREVLIED